MLMDCAGKFHLCRTKQIHVFFYNIYMYVILYNLISGKLTLKIPWKNLYTEPVIATIDGLYALAVPNVGRYM